MNYLVYSVLMLLVLSQAYYVDQLQHQVDELRYHHDIRLCRLENPVNIARVAACTTRAMREFQQGR